MILPAPHRNFAQADRPGAGVKFRWGMGKIIFPMFLRHFSNMASAEWAGWCAGVDRDGVLDAQDVLEGAGGGEEAGFALGRGDDLEADGEAVLGEAAG